MATTPEKRSARRVRLGTRGAVVAVSAFAMLALAAGIAYATIPDSGNVYTACILNKVGTIRLVDPSLGNSSLMGHCTQLETQITWNQHGQKGDPGPAGLQGPPGPPGASAQLDPYIRTNILDTNSEDPTGFSATCDPGDVLLNGGYRISPLVLPDGGWAATPAFAEVINAMPVYTPPDRWSFEVVARSLTGEAFELVVRADCVKAS